MPKSALDPITGPSALWIRLTALEGLHGRPPRAGDRRMAFHISRHARRRYAVPETWFQTSGNLLLADFHAARVLARGMNESRDLARYPERAVQAGRLNAMGLIDEILHYVVELYREQVDPRLMTRALEHLDTVMGPAVVDGVLERFVESFPPPGAAVGAPAAAAYLREATPAGVSHREVVLEEVLLLNLANRNPAFEPFQELFDDQDLETATAYRELTDRLTDFVDARPPFGPDRQGLATMLRSPAVAEPYSLTGQLNYIRERWGLILRRYLFVLLSSLDLVREEERQSFTGPGPTVALDRLALAGWDDIEAERFSPDRDWMPRLVLMAKSTHVWLHQLSRRYGRPVGTLAEVPDEELDTLARWGFTGLWLIGLWARSPASREIKRLCGNPEALASAYSLHAYEIAADLGGEAALENLRQRAWQRGIRLAGDMVPNHMGIDSPWVREHPDWFIQLDHSPFPAYRFTGPDLSGDGRVTIQVEDHYFDRSDAAVVFRWQDRESGANRFIYHGNDGTSMPWNDTAQLDYLRPEVREAVIQTILAVARRFPVIRFDAAMTLTKRHFQRLWYPEPGQGGDIPTRAGRGLTRADFERHMPIEFWREVVDRIAAEAPDTLLLAEAFWLMEGYFVRTLGMHRVYNSAFMNMLKAEENAKFRTTLKNVLEFQPEILKRFVNFLNNPDEETAVAQFGKGDKYFGVCLMLASLPGLPMFGHGQVEGFTEKYGMEFRRSYRDETPDTHLVRRHEELIFPVLRRRALWAEAERFRLYDFRTAAGEVDENVFAYSNRRGEDSGLILYHNRYAATAGWVRHSVAYAEAAVGAGGDRQMASCDLVAGLGLEPGAGRLVAFRDAAAGLEYIRAVDDLAANGLYVELGAYQSHVFVDFRPLTDSPDGHWAALNAFLNGRGVPSLELALAELRLAPVHRAYADLVAPACFRTLLPWPDDGAEPEFPPEGLAPALHGLAEAVGRYKGIDLCPADALATMTRMRTGWRHLLAGGPGPDPSPAWNLARAHLLQSQRHWYTLFGWLTLQVLHPGAGPDDPERRRSLMTECLLGRQLGATFRSLGMPDAEADRRVGLVRALLGLQHWWWSAPDSRRLVRQLFADPDAQVFLGVNRHQDVLWFHQESFETLLMLLLAVAVADAAGDPPTSGESTGQLSAAANRIPRLLELAAEARYQVERLLSLTAAPTPDEPDAPSVAEAPPSDPEAP